MRRLVRHGLQQSHGLRQRHGLQQRYGLRQRYSHRGQPRRRPGALAVLLLATLLLAGPGHGQASPANAPTPPGSAPGSAGGSTTNGLPAVTPVASLDLERYAGLWHEIARIPNRFQKQCFRGSQARYQLRADGRIGVLNQCIRRSGVVDQASGVARVIDPVSRARLQVSLVSFLGWRPFWGDYWVIGLDPDYRWAVVGSPDRRYGWVLARTPELDAAALEQVNAVITRNGYDPARFVFTDGTPWAHSRTHAGVRSAGEEPAAAPSLSK